MLTLGIVGRARAGKTTVASAILKEAASQNLRTELFEFGSYVLKEAIDLNRIPSKERSQLTEEEIRQLVILGSERREQDPYYWIKALVSDIGDRQPDVAVVSGVRFLNEAEAIQKTLGGKIIRVKSYIIDGVEYISTDRNPNHVSETEHHRIVADYYITTQRGESKLTALQATTLFNYLYARQ